MANRCRWCGRFFASSNPYDEACWRHHAEERAENRRSIERHNARIAAAKIEPKEPQP